MARTLSFLVSLLLACSLFADIKPPSEKEKWLKVTSGEFRILSNASERATRRIVTDLVNMREALGKITRLKVRGSVPVHVFVFRDERSFAQYRDALMQRKNASAAGLFFGDADAKFVVLSAATPDTQRLVYHELTHYFVRNTVANLPLWFNEGIAEYYSTFDAKDDVVEIGKHLREHIIFLKHLQPMPLRKLFAIDASSPEYNESARQGVFYAQSWALVHYLLIGDSAARRAQVSTFLDLLQAGKPTEEAFTKAFETTYEGMEQQLRIYLRKPAMQYIKYTAGELNAPKVPQPQPASRSEVLSGLGKLLAHANAGTLADGEALLTEAARLDPKNAEAHAQLGTVKMRSAQYEAAIAAFDKAIALGSNDTDAYVYYAAALLQKENATEADLARAREYFAVASQIDPTNARAFAGVGATYVGSDDDPRFGIDALEKSLKLAPSQEDVALNLIHLYAKAGRRADAQRIIDTVLANSTDPQTVTYAAEVMLRIDLIAARDLMEKGKGAEAIPIFERVRAATKSEPLKQQIDGMIGHARLMAQVDRVNAAIDLSNKGRLTEALKILDEVVPQMKDADMKAQAEKLRADLKKRRGK